LPQSEVALLRLHLLEKKPLADLCEEHQLSVNLFYVWQKQFFDKGAAAFAPSDKRRKALQEANDCKSAALADKLQRKCSVLDGGRRSIVHWAIRETMKEEVEPIIQRARERVPGEKPRIISDNGPQFVAREFQGFIRVCGMTHVKTSPSSPQSTGKIERFHRTLQGDCIRTRTPLCLEDARRVVARYVAHSHTVRLQSAIGSVTLQAKLAGEGQGNLGRTGSQTGSRSRQEETGASAATPGRSRRPTRRCSNVMARVS
jgi:transposase InsO family protein